MKMGFIFSTVLILLCVACSPFHPSPKTSQPAANLVKERFVSQSFIPDNLDSIAIYKNASNPWALVTAKSTDAVLVFNLNNGSLVKRIGQTGSGKGDLRRPNGIWADANFLMVVERDNRRVQVFRLPDFQSLGSFGSRDLQKPYGLTCFQDDRGAYQVFVTDDFALGKGRTSQERVKHFEVRLDHGHLHATKKAQFGEASGKGMLFKVESILADPSHDRLLIADEKGPHVGVKIYDLKGNYTGELLATEMFEAEPEGLGLYATGPNSGFIIATDQQAAITVFHIYHRASLKHLGTFQGAKTANTDGIAVISWSTNTFSEGALWAIHDDQALAAFDWRTIQSQVRLETP